MLALPYLAVLVLTNASVSDQALPPREAEPQYKAICAVIASPPEKGAVPAPRQWCEVTFGAPPAPGTPCTCQDAGWHTLRGSTR